MHKLLLVVLVGCGTDVQSSDLVGTWNGTASNGKTSSYTFDDKGAFTFVEGGLSLTGTYSVTFPMLELDTATTHSNLSYVFADNDKFCDASFAVSVQANGVVGSWSQTVITTDVASGQSTNDSHTIVLNADLTMTEDTSAGTYTQSGQDITIDIPEGGGVDAVRTFTLVSDGNFCDPVYVKGS
jgi:hypothetical protein